MTDQPGLFVVISAPSGGGKDVVINELLKIFPNSARIVNTTSKPPRPDNHEGVDYHFIDAATFQNKIAAGDFLEYNNYAGNFYGTEKRILAETLASHPVVFSHVEVNGKHNFDKNKVPHLSFFLLPDSLDDLRGRIEKRGGLTEDKIEERLKIAKKEIEESADYDYRIVNHEGGLEQTVAEIAGIIRDGLNSTLDKNG